MAKRIAVLVGSLRKESFTRKIAKELIKLAPATLEMQIIEIGQLPLYNQDYDEAPPQEWLSFRRQISETDGFLFATPEYNRSVSPAMKNAIDVGSRPYGQSVWEGKPGAIISVSPGIIGGFGANHHLRQSLVFLNVPCMQQPEAYISHVTNVLNEDGTIKNNDTVEFLRKYINAVAKWVETNAKRN